jgi:hypothetical protein
VHQTTIERAFGRIFAMLIALIVVVFWFDSATLAGQRPGSMANLLLSALLIWQAARALRRPPSQQDLYVLAAATGALLPISRALAVPGSPFLIDGAYLLAVPAAVAWAVWSVRFVVPVPVLLVVLATGVWAHGGDLAVEQTVVALATVACTSWAVRLIRAGARRADADAGALSRRMAAQDAALAAEEVESRAATTVPPLIFAGFMLPVLLSGLVLLCLHWQDMRWQAAAAAAFGGIVGLAVLSARHLSQVQMTRQVGVGLAAANIILAAVGSLAVAPGTTDAFAYWIAGDSGIVIAAVYFILGPVFGLTALAVDLAALTAGLLATGHSIAAGGWVSMLTSPVIGAGLAAAMLAAFRSLSSHTESQLAQYRERLRLQARAETISRVDSTALENARRVAGPVLSAVICSPARDPDLQTAAALANATLRDELLAPGFLTASLAERVHAARAAGASITIKFARQSDTALAETARELLAAALADLDADDDITFEMHPGTEGHPALLILRARSARSDHASLRRAAAASGALVSDLGDHELLIRLQSHPSAQQLPPLTAIAYPP